MAVDLEAIREGLAALGGVTIKPDVFGAEAHEFLLNPPLSEEAVREFESTHRAKLPEEYRTFLMQVGNGGAGPYYGLFKLGEVDDGWEHAPWTENDGLVGTLAEPFPYSEPWNDLTGAPEFDQTKKSDPEWLTEYERQLDTFQSAYWNSTHVNGAIPICHLGCALRQWLVVTGPESGHVWCDFRADRGGLLPLQEGGRKRVTFLQWYRVWLDEALSELGRSRQD